MPAIRQFFDQLLNEMDTKPASSLHQDRDNSGFSTAEHRWHPQSTQLQQRANSAIIGEHSIGESNINSNTLLRVRRCHLAEPTINKQHLAEGGVGSANIDSGSTVVRVILYYQST